MFNESISILYIRLRFVWGGEGESKLINIDIYKNISVYEARKFMMTKTIPRKVYILEDCASGVQVGDIKQAIIFKKLMIFYKFGSQRQPK